jgi:hypothetical protein
MNMSQLYEKDFYQWTIKMSEALRQKDINKLDYEHLAEEIDLMSGRDRQELKNRLAILMMHLLKWQYQPELRGSSWQKTIMIQRNDIQDNFEYSPSLKHYVDDILPKSYKKAVLKASSETGLSLSVFPNQLPYTIDQLLNEDYYPDNQQGV